METTNSFKSRVMYYVYVLICSDNRLYIGCTNNIADRMARHNNGYVPATKGRFPVKLVNYIAFSNKYKAYKFEKYLKTGSGRAFTNKHLI